MYTATGISDKEQCLKEYAALLVKRYRPFHDAQAAEQCAR